MNLTREDYLNGQIVLVDKPMGWTSFQAVNALKWALRKTFDLPKKFKIGHAGTLDPLATGLLLICTGKATKQIPQLQDQTKTYTGTFTLGATRPSYDMETDIDQQFSTAHVTKDLITQTLPKFLGPITQVPPIYSAVKKDGKRAYELARKGQEVTLKSRTVQIHDFTISRIAIPQVDFEIHCSKGTYIRSITNDFGKALQSGAYLSALRRTKIGFYNVDKATSPQAFKTALSK